MFAKFAYEQPRTHKFIDIVLLKRFLPYLLPHRGYVVGALILMPFMITAELAQPYLLKTAIDRYILQSDYNGLVRISILFMFLMLLEFIFKYYHYYYLQAAGQRVVVDIRDALFRHTESLSLSFFDKTPVGVLITRITNDLEVINEMFSAGLVLLISDTLKLIVIVTLMAYMSLRLTLITLLVVPVLAAGAIYFRSELRDAFREIRVRIAKMNAHIQETLNGIETVQMFNAEKIRFDSFEKENNKHRRANFRSIKNDAMLFASVELLLFISIALLIGYGGTKMLHGVITFGVLVAFLEYLRKFFIPIRDLSAKYAIMQSAMAALEKIFSLFDVQNKIALKREYTDIPAPAPHFPHIEYKKVSFFYKQDVPILKDVSFSILPRRHIAIVGATGAGKTSLVRILLRLYENQEGEILYCGRNINEIPPRQLRERILLVSQDVYLFSGELRYNLTLGRKDLSDKELEESFYELGVEHFLERFPRGFSTILNERGSNLSTGERQLLSFIRAYLLNPDVLILDEATAHIDIETERLLKNAMQRGLKNKTAILIAHRLQTIRYADRILVFHKGRLKEEGTHNELLNDKGIYHTLYHSQFFENYGILPGGAG